MTTYDQEGRILQVASPEGTLNYRYDTLGHRIRVFTGTEADPTEDVRYTYDALGRVATVEASQRNGVPVDADATTAGNQPETTRYVYDLAGNLAREVKPNGVVSDYVYDQLNRLDTLTQFQDANGNGHYDAGVDTLLAEFDYTVRDDGKRTAATERFWFDDNADGILDPHENRVTWIYDNLGRLTDEVFDHYDNSLDQTEHFVYDLVGNRVSQTVDKGNDGTVDETTSYTYDANDRLTEETSSTGRTTTYGYDHTQQTSKEASENGTATSRTDYTYDLQGRMETATVTTYTDGIASKVERTTYEYDASGIRVSALLEVDASADGQFETSTKTEYLNDPSNPTGYSQVLKETVTDPATGQVQKTIVYTVGLDQISQTTVTYADGQPQSEETLLFSMDGHGSTRALLNMLGAIATVNGMRQLFHYDAFGNVVGFDVSKAATSFLYNSEQFDALTGLSYLRARYYDAATGRFNRLDPFFGNLNDPQSLHKYLFCHGDGINGIDPSGQENLISVSITMTIRVGLFALNAWSAFSAARAGLEHGIRAYECFSTGDFWDGTVHVAAMLIDGLFLGLSLLGMRGAVNFTPPPAMFIGAGGVVAANGTIGLVWQAVLNPAFEAWFARELVPAIAKPVAGILFAAASGHHMDWELRDGRGRIRTRGSEDSGGTQTGHTPSWPEQAATHTEKKMLEKLKNIVVNKGDILTLRGTKPPCNPGRPPYGNGTGCLPALQRFAREKGVKIFYQTEQGVWTVRPDGVAVFPDGSVLRAPL